MSNRFRSYIICFSIGIFPIAILADGVSSPFSNKLLGRCFADLSGALVAVGGDAYSSDENIVLTESNTSQKHRWIVDKTSGHNYQWYFVESNTKNNSQCISLYIPFASEVDSYSKSGTLTIEAKTQASPGFPRYIMNFRHSIKTNYYVPAVCYKEDFESNSKSPIKTEIDCLKVAEQ
jgi:hypothetical protein